MRRLLPSAVVALLLIRAVTPVFADGRLSESIRVDWDPFGSLSVRAVARFGGSLDLAIAGNSGDENQRIRLGVATPSLVVGPLAVSGAYRELLGSKGGPRSDAWYVPGRIGLDASLGSSRRGLAFRPLSVMDLFVWESSRVVVGTRIGLGNRVAFAEVLGTLTSVVSIPTTSTDATPSWFEDRAPALPIGNVIARAVGAAEWGTVGSSVSASFPGSALPGLSLRGSGKLWLPGRWQLAGIGFLATPDFRLPDGERPDEPARWGAALRREGRFVDAGIDFARAYESEDAAYDAIGFATESLVGSDAEATGSITTRRRDVSRRVASVGGQVRFEFPVTEALAWRARVSFRIAPPDRRLEISPSLALASGYHVSGRVRAVYSMPGLGVSRSGSQSALDFALVGDYERDPEASDIGLSVSVRTTIERDDG